MQQEESGQDLRSKGTPTRRLTVLVVEDDAYAPETLGTLLEMDGLRVLGAGTVADAIAVGRREALIDLLVTDISLPDGRGDAVAVALEQRHPTMRSIFLSGDSSVTLTPRQRFVCKPARIGTILREVHALMEA
jgi:response regulator RpfG family c-di-GMP phosphodiesterase